MKKLKKQCILSMTACILLVAGLLTACAGKSHDAQQNVNEPETELNEDGTDAGGDVAEVDMKQEWKDMPVIREDSKITELRTLNSEELSEFTEFITEADGYRNYGFLLSVYDSPEKIDMDEVFYTGAGIKTEPLSAEEEKAFLNAVGDEEIYTDVVKLTTAQINDVLLKRTGLTYEQMANPLQWTYLPEYDAYYHEAGDTNYAAYTCVGGTTADEKRFTLYFKRDDSLMESAYYEMYTETVLEKTEEGYCFISNRLITEEEFSDYDR